MTIAAVVVAIAMLNAFYPAISRSSGALVQSSASLDDRIKSQVEIVHATGELDKNGAWQDTNSNGDFDMFLWVKNVGNSRILAIDQMDLFFGKTGDFARIPHETYASGAYPSWSYSLANGTEWLNAVTAKLDIHYESAQTSTTYTIKVVTPSGAYDEHQFSF